MNDSISRKDAIDALNEYFARIGNLKRRGLNKGEKAISLDTVGVIKTLPSAQPEQKRGKWEEFAYATTYDICGLNKAIGLKCSLCKEKKYDRVKTQYCPNCGAKMEE